jgi:hypothetical protein
MNNNIGRKIKFSELKEKLDRTSKATLNFYKVWVSACEELDKDSKAYKDLFETRDSMSNAMILFQLMKADIEDIMCFWKEILEKNHDVCKSKVLKSMMKNFFDIEG